MFDYNKAKDVDKSIWIDDRFYNARKHIETFMESVGMSDMLK